MAEDTVQILSKVALGFWPPLTAKEKKKAEYTPTPAPNPDNFIRVQKDVITRVPKWVLHNRAFILAAKDGNVVVLQDIPLIQVGEDIQPEADKVRRPRSK